MAARLNTFTRIAADFMTTFYHVQVGALENQEFRTTPAPFWLVCFFGQQQKTKIQSIKRCGELRKVLDHPDRSY